MPTLAEITTAADTLDSAHDALIAGDAHQALTDLRAELAEIRSRLPLDRWRTFGEAARQHPVHRRLLESPFTRRAYEKPRGYPGDAVLMDLIYGRAPAGDECSPLGGMLYAFEFDSPCFQSVRARRAVIAREIDRVAMVRPGAAVLSVASGHLREIEWSAAARSRAVTVTALDQDRESLACIEQDYAGLGVRTLPVTIGDLLRRTVRFTGIDLAYAAGLYDYLGDDVGRALTTALFRTMAPGGRLLIANFTPATADAAFMETFMDWHLVYRSASQVRALAAAIPPGEIASVEQFCDSNRHIAYMRVVKRS